MNLILADSNDLIRVGLRTILNSQKEIQIVGEAKDNAELKDLIKNFEKMDLRFSKYYGLSSIPGFPETSLLGILARSLLSFQDKPLILLDLVRLR